MILEKGDMWSEWGESSLWLFTGNSYINKADELVMGCGLALAVKEQFPELPLRLGRKIPHLGIYGTVRVGNIGAFQVKRHFGDKAELSLIGYSCIELMRDIDECERVDLNFPGIGAGGLKREQVLPIISELPDCVHVWELK